MKISEKSISADIDLHKKTPIIIVDRKNIYYKKR